MKIFRTKSLEEIMATAEKHSLHRTLGAVDLLLLGVGCIIGTGIFVLTGIAAAEHAGPAIIISYMLAGLACVFTALAYTELAAMVPVAGSAYTYSYAVLGEFVAWLVGWGLVLEYGIGASAVASGWSGYMVGVLEAGGIHLPSMLTKTPSEGGIINLPASLIIILVTLLLVKGTKESATLNKILVFVKLGAVFLFTWIAVPHIKAEHWEHFMPFGWSGVLAGAATIFYAYVGFDAVATAAEEAKNPNRDLPIGIIGSLIVCTILYVLVSGLLTAIVPFKTLDNPEPLAYALRLNGNNIGSALVATGAIAGMTTVLLVLLYGQARIFFVMARDGMLPQAFCKIHPRFHTPYLNSLFVGSIVSVVAGVTPIKIIGHMASMGTLFAFMTVCIGVIILRVTRPDIKRPFKCPAVMVVAPLAIICCAILWFSLVNSTGKPFFIWMLLGCLIYFGYSYRHSHAHQ